MTNQHYILKDKKLVPVDPVTWATWFGTAERHVGNDYLPNGYRVSTIFFGLDHNFTPIGRPLLFETMVFPEGSSSELAMKRYSTYEEAEEGHKKMVKEWAKRKAPYEHYKKIKL